MKPATATFTYPTQRLDPRVAERRRQSFLAEVHSASKALEPAAAAEQPPGPELKQLIVINDHRDWFSSELYQAAGLSPAQGIKAVEELTARGLIQAHKLVRAGSGRQPRVYETLPAADPVLARAGLQRTARLLRGGFRHDVYGRFLARWAAAQGYRCEYEKSFGDKCFDLLCQKDSGEILGVEICLSGTAERTGQQLLAGLKNDGLTSLLAAFENRKLLNAVSKEMDRIDPALRSSGRLAVRFLGEFITQL